MAKKPALVLGATGGFGGALTRELLARGVAVRALVRDGKRARALLGRHHRLTVLTGDALDPVAVDGAADGCGLIVHGVNYPYHQWSPNMQIATENVTAAAEQQKATVLFAGNVYGLGAQTHDPLTETAANRPVGPKGALRVALEDHMRDVAASSDCRVLVVRAGDFFGPSLRNPLTDRIFGNALHGKPMTIFGDPARPHQWAYLPDLARAAVDLIGQSRRLDAFEVVNFGGVVVDPQEAFPRAVAKAAGHPELRLRTTPWWAVRVSGWFNPQARELLELRYLFDDALILDNRKLRRLLPAFRATSMTEAIRQTLASYRSEDAAATRPGQRAL